MLRALDTGARLDDIACLDLVDFVEEKGMHCIAIYHIPRAKPHTDGIQIAWTAPLHFH